MSKIPSGIELPNFKKQQTSVAVDLMRPGNGTPWEDRGTSGAISAYFKTVFKSFTSPGLLMDHIRRPETTSDAKWFALVSALMWFVGLLLWNVYWYIFVLPVQTDFRHEVIYPTNYWASAFAEAAIVPLGIWLWMTVGPKLYRSLAGAELSGVSPTLIYNCFAYSLGPSILAVIPLVPRVLPAPFMWVIAALWVHFNLIVAGKRRLYLKTASAIVNVCLIAGAVLIISVAGYYVAKLVWLGALDMSGLEAPPPVVKPSH
jgi:hypothetical protein